MHSIEEILNMDYNQFADYCLASEDKSEELYKILAEYVEENDIQDTDHEMYYRKNLVATVVHGSAKSFHDLFNEDEEEDDDYEFDFSPSIVG